MSICNLNQNVKYFLHKGTAFEIFLQLVCFIFALNAQERLKRKMSYVEV